MPEFFHSQAFAFIIGCVVGGAFGFLLACILAAPGKASRMEERISDEAIHEAAEREEKRCGIYLPGDMTSDVEDILGRKVG